MAEMPLPVTLTYLLSEMESFFVRLLPVLHSLQQRLVTPQGYATVLPGVTESFIHCWDLFTYLQAAGRIMKWLLSTGTLGHTRI